MKNIKTFEDLIAYSNKSNLKIYEICQKTEALEAEVSEGFIRERAKKILDVMKRYIPANMYIDPTVKLKQSEQNIYTGAAFRMKIKGQLRVGKEEVNDES